MSRWVGLIHTINGCSAANLSRLRSIMHLRIEYVIFMTISTAAPETFYDDFIIRFFGSYTSSFFHIDNEIDAIFRANVNFAKFGFVPPSS